MTQSSRYRRMCLYDAVTENHPNVYGSILKLDPSGSKSEHCHDSGLNLT